MLALIWKELRENFKWALLGLLVLGGAEYVALNPPVGGSNFPAFDSQRELTLCKTAFLTVTTFGCAAVGLLLGLLQILPELKRDRWAALLHRPVSRGAIFAGKAVAGLILYCATVVPPFLFCVWWTATPGHFGAPFVPAMALPGTADICMGAVWYFAGLTLALQKGGWVGLRVLPLFAALYTSGWVLKVDSFSDAAEAAAWMAVALVVAAWGAFYNQELLRERPWAGRFAFLAVVLYGVCGLGGLAESLIKAVMPAQTFKEFHYAFSEEGVPLRLTYLNGAVVSVQDLDGKPATDPRYEPEHIGNHLLNLHSVSSWIGDMHELEVWTLGGKGTTQYRKSESFLEVISTYTYPRFEMWFLVKPQRSMVCYLPLETTAVERLDRRGFQPMSVAPEGFSPETEIVSVSDDCICLWNSKGARLAYVGKRELLEFPRAFPGPIYGVGNADVDSDKAAPVTVTALAQANAMSVYDGNAALIATLPYHQDVTRWGRLSFGLNATKDRFYLWYKPSFGFDFDKRAKTMPSFLDETDAQGRVLHSYTLPPLPAFPRPVGWDTFLEQRLQSPFFFFGRMACQKIQATLGSKPARDALARQFGEGRRHTLELALSITALSLLLAGATLFWARRVHFPWRRAWAWAGFVLLFNLAGFITFRLAADWPRLVGCPRCGRSRPVDTASCPHCGQGWPGNELTGTEIFDSEPVEALDARA